MIPGEAWAVLSCGAGAKGERLSEWAAVELLSFRLGDKRRWLLVRRTVGEPQEMAYYVVSADAETTLEEMVRVAGARWAIEESFETAKGEVGLDQYEVRSWAGWYRHVTLCLPAHAYLTATRAEAARRKAEKSRPRPPAESVWGAGRGGGADPADGAGSETTAVVAGLGENARARARSELVAVAAQVSGSG